MIQFQYRISNAISLPFIVFLLMASIGSVAFAATLEVSNTNDAGPGSLRQAVADANGNGQANTITFRPEVFLTPRTILLTSGEIFINTNVTNGLTIEGPGLQLLTISGGGNSRIFRIQGGNGTITLRGLTVTQGRSTIGGAIYSSGHVTIVASMFSENVAAGSESIGTTSPSSYGGAIYAQSGVAVVDSTFRANFARGLVRVNSSPTLGDDGESAFGGAIYSNRVSVFNSTFEGNGAIGRDAPASGTGENGGRGGGGYGGAIGVGFALESWNSTFKDNQAVGGHGASVSSGFAGKGGEAQGGAVISSGSTMINSTFLQNSARAGNGGISPDTFGSATSGTACGGAICESGNFRAANLTITSNTAAGGNGRDGGNATGGGVGFRGEQQFQLLNLTVTNNTVTGGTGVVQNGWSRGGGVHSNPGNTPIFRNCLVAFNTASEGTDVYGAFGTTPSNNLIRIGDATANIVDGQNGNKVGTLGAPIDPLLGKLAANGGLTLTQALLAGSPAIDAGNNQVWHPVYVTETRPLDIDQRNYQRVAPVGGVIDIGAFEFNAAAVVPASGVPDLQTPSDTGGSGFDDYTSASTTYFDVRFPILGATVELLRDGVPVGSTVAASATTILRDASPPSDGVVRYSTRQTIGGITSDASGMLTVTYDNTAPSLTINQAVQQADPATSLPLVFDVVLSESGVGIDPNDISLVGSTANVELASISVSFVSTFVRRVEIRNIRTPGKVVANIPAGRVCDMVALCNAPSSSTDNSINFTPPKLDVPVSGRVLKSGFVRLPSRVVFTDILTGETFDARTFPDGSYRFNRLPTYADIGKTFRVSVVNKRFRYDHVPLIFIATGRVNLNFSIP